MSDIELIKILLERMRARGGLSCLEDEHLVLDGNAASSAVLELSQTISSHTPEHGCVLICLPNSVAQAVATLACLAAGRIPILCNPWVRSWQGFVEDGFPIELVLYAGEDRATDGLGFDAFRICLRTLTLFKTVASERSTVAAAVPADIALVVYTSGSSGRPKPVGIVFKSIEYMCSALVAELGLTEQTRAVIAMPMFHTLAINTQFLPTIYVGGSCVFLNPELEMGSLMRRLMVSKGTYLALVAEVVQQLGRERKEHGLAAATTVDQVVLAGGQITKNHLMEARALFPYSVIHRGYGLTEAIRVTMTNSGDPDFELLANGKPLQGQDLRVCGASGAELPQGHAGMIFVKGPNTGNVIFGQSSKSSMCDGYLCTGDIGFINAYGGLEVLGRSDRVFKSQGRKVAPAEIELSVTHLSDVAKAVCVPAPCVRKGFRPVLVVELNRRLDINEMEPVSRLSQFLSASLRARLEPYKVPREVLLLEDMPMLPSLKPNVNALIGMCDKMQVSEWKPHWVAAGIRFYTAPAALKLEY